MHFDAVALGPNQTSFAENFEVLRESRLRDAAFADPEKSGTALGTVRPDDIGIDGYTHGVGKSVEDAFDGYVLDRRMEKWSHSMMIRRL